MLVVKCIKKNVKFKKIKTDYYYYAVKQYNSRCYCTTINRWHVIIGSLIDDVWLSDREFSAMFEVVFDDDSHGFLSIMRFIRNDLGIPFVILPSISNDRLSVFYDTRIDDKSEPLCIKHETLNEAVNYIIRVSRKKAMAMIRVRLLDFKLLKFHKKQ